jgi:hypothetical protein
MRIGAEVMLAEGLPNYLTGGIVGVRVHSPIRFSPYVGVAGMAGVADSSTTAQFTYFDQRGNVVNKGDRVGGVTKGLAAIIPEVGLSYWLTSRVRLNVGTSYYLTADGGSGSINRDFALATVSLDWLFARESEIETWRDPPLSSQPTDATDGAETKSYFTTDLSVHAPIDEDQDGDAAIPPPLMIAIPIDELPEETFQ